MSAAKVPTVLIADDRPDEVRGLADLIRNDGCAKVSVRHPDEIERLDVTTADLVLVDYGIEEWLDPQPDRDRISRIPGNGLALASVLQSHVSKKQPVAFAILTAKMDELTFPLPPEYREHAYASMNNLDWVFDKSKLAGDNRLDRQIRQLALAVTQLPQGWKPYEPGGCIAQLAGLLGLDLGNDEGCTLMEDVLQCHPPLYELSESSHGLAIIRWLLHRILPYPSFLLDYHYLAARLRIDYGALSNALRLGFPLQKALASCEYGGIVPTFLGPRWWRLGIESLLSHETDGRASDIAAVRHTVNRLASEELPPSEPPDFPVVCIDQNYEPMSQLRSIEDSVRIRPDDWPAYADQAWTTAELAKDDQKLLDLVIDEDKERLG